MVLYRVFPFKYYIHESLHSHSCMNSCYSFMCYVMVLWLLLSLDMIGMFHISYYTVIPMLYQRLHVVIIHRLFFLVDLWLCCWVYNIPILTYRLHIQEYISIWETCTLFKKHFFIGIITTNHLYTKKNHYTLYRIVELKKIIYKN